MEYGVAGRVCGRIWPAVRVRACTCVAALQKNDPEYRQLLLVLDWLEGAALAGPIGARSLAIVGDFKDSFGDLPRLSADADQAYDPQRPANSERIFEEVGPNPWHP